MLINVPAVIYFTVLKDFHHASTKMLFVWQSIASDYEHSHS